MSLFQEATRTHAKGKVGLYGAEGTGKTITATLMAIALNAHIKSSKPIAFFDTETGSDFALELIERAGMKLLTIKSRALTDLGKAFDEVPSVADVFVIDSLTHPYKELLETYQAMNKEKHGSRFLTIRDWGVIKPIWAKNFSTPYVNSPVHCIWCARSKNLFEEVDDPEAGNNKTRLISVGTGVRSETESAYEPSLLIEMTKEYVQDGGKYLRKATVVKDRTMRIDSHEFTFDPADMEKLMAASLKDAAKAVIHNPVWQAFYPHFERLNLAGEHKGFEETVSSDLVDEGPKDIAAYRRRQEIAWEKIDVGFGVIFPGHAKADKQGRFAVMSALLGTTSDKEAAHKPPDLLESVLPTLTELADLSLHSELPQDPIALQNKAREIYERKASGVGEQASLV